MRKTDNLISRIEQLERTTDNIWVVVNKLGKEDDSGLNTIAYMGGYRDAEAKYQNSPDVVTIPAKYLPLKEKMKQKDRQIELLAERLENLFDCVETHAPAHISHSYDTWFDDSGAALIPEVEDGI